jgi:G3E family GTPase
MEKERNRKIAVLMNEFGNVSIDTDIIGDEVPLKELLGGCICCTIQDKLEAQIQSLLIDHKPEVIYIETTGVAHPVEVLDAIMSPLFANAITVKGIVTVVDGTRWLNRKSLSPSLQQLVIEQVRHADLIVLNKSAELTEGEKIQVTTGIQSLNSHAELIMTNFSKLGPLQMEKLILKKKHVENIDRVKISLALSSFVYNFKNPIKQVDFEEFLKLLPDSIYRIKGYVKFTHSSQPILFQFSYGMPLYLREEMNLPLNLVFIGENIDWLTIQDKLTELETKAE